MIPHGAPTTWFSTRWQSVATPSGPARLQAEVRAEVHHRRDLDRRRRRTPAPRRHGRIQRQVNARVRGSARSISRTREHVQAADEIPRPLPPRLVEPLPRLLDRTRRQRSSDIRSVNGRCSSNRLNEKTCTSGRPAPPRDGGRADPASPRTPATPCNPQSPPSRPGDPSRTTRKSGHDPKPAAQRGELRQLHRTPAEAASAPAQGCAGSTAVGAAAGRVTGRVTGAVVALTTFVS